MVTDAILNRNVLIKSGWSECCCSPGVLSAFMVNSKLHICHPSISTNAYHYLTANLLCKMHLYNVDLRGSAIICCHLVLDDFHHAFSPPSLKPGKV